ncbi:MAG: dethiobiotin synthase [Verrucomicrobia bacterium]|nr:dethiobiotin synthase [Verrucomicrobiota bacterium]
MNLFITATDTNAGKTYVTCLLLEALKAQSRRAVGFKPFCCGGREDSVALLSASSAGLTLDEINPVWLKTPASPYAAALIENRLLDLERVSEAYHELTHSYENVIVEGVGGWEVPLAPQYTSADFAESLGLPVVVVVNNKLGALNHTILTVKNIQARQLQCAGLILNHVSDERDPASIPHRMILEDMLDVPVLGEVLHGETDGSALLEALQVARQTSAEI